MTFALICNEQKMKERERRLAHTLYVKERKSAKECAQMVGVTERTIGEWVSKYNWKEQRDALVNAPDSLVKNLKELISSLTEKRIELEQDPEATPKEKARLADEVAKYTKALEAAKKENEIPLHTYVHVMERVFKAIQIKHPKLYQKLIDFQEEHLNEVSQEL